MPIVNDEINEPEELFIIVLSIQSSLYSDGLTVNPTQRSSLCRIFDNDGRLACCVNKNLAFLVHYFTKTVPLQFDSFYRK